MTIREAKIATPLSRKAVLVSVKISQWTARKLDRKVTDETNAKYNATKDAGRYNKRLIAAEHLEEMQKLVTKARDLHYTMTQPWADEGPRILSNMLFRKFTDEFRVLKRDFNIAADRFAASYPQMVEQRKTALNGLFNANDYPSAREIRSRFQLEMTVLPFPDADDFRSDLDADTVADIKQELREQSNKVIDNAMKSTTQQIVALVGNMAQRLKEYKVKDNASFRDSLVENIRELAELLPAFNLTNDPKLDQITDRIKSELCVEDAQTLRDNDAVRVTVQKSADEIVKTVASLFA